MRFQFFLLMLVFFNLKAQPRQCLYDASFVPVIDLHREALTFRSLVTVPVVVHVISTTETEVSDFQIHAQIHALNRDFRKRGKEWLLMPQPFRELAADAYIEFELASVAPNGLPTLGINRKKINGNNAVLNDDIFYAERGGIDAWDTNRYLNIWVVEMHEALLGYASSPNDAGLPTDGVVININYFGTSRAESTYQLGRTLVHEVGHYLGLSHPWGDIKNECEEDDGLEDTPILRGPHYSCPPTDDQSCNGIPYYWNFMDYTPDCCMAMFTHMQAAQMQATLSYYRPQLSIASFDEPLQTAQFAVVPNPAKSAVAISWEDPIKSIEVYTSDGRMIRTFHPDSSDRYWSLCLSGYPKGILILVFHRNNGLRTVQKLLHL